MLTMIRRVLRSLREEGPIGTARRTHYHCYERYREWRLGISTYPSVDRHYPNGSHECRPYEPLSFDLIDRAMAHLKPCNSDVILDYGCGRGRVLAVAASHPFRRVIGVEMDAGLCKSARDNLQRMRGRIAEWEIVEGDATLFSLPNEVNVVFLFNPFLGTVLAKVVQKIEESVRAQPRKLSVVYVNPFSDSDVFESCRWLSLQAELPVGLWRGTRFRLYQSVSSAPQ